VTDANDICPDTSAEALVTSSGCSVDQLCPCEAGWESHGDYVSCVAGAANVLKAEGTISGEDHGDLANAAARSECGRK
jgi:hypothetical protein